MKNLLVGGLPSGAPGFLFVLLPALLLTLLPAGCARRERAAGSAAADSATVRAMAWDRAEHLVMPLAPAGAGRVTLQAVAEVRAALAPLALAPVRVEPAPPALELALPAAEPAPVPEPATAAAAGPEALALKPPIPRGAPRMPSGGRGGRVTLDVRVDESGEVSDVELVETDADSATVRAATEAAFATHYHPALLGARRVAVWTRQQYDVRRER